ncbi:MAG: UDP-N-acetylglucosamine 1-carboxyvinyltransferase [bacterium]|nr:UDP-N-acetylglucosamine 1-carboxyvinyltransferase [bacterium]
MSKLIVTGGTPLYGSVRVGGAKNASYKIMIAALLADSPSRLLNLPAIADVQLTSEIIRDLGGKADSCGERMLAIDPRGLNKWEVDAKFGQASRASTIFLPVLLAKFGRGSVPLPGGDKIGKRPLERHFAGLQALGAEIKVENGRITAELPQKRFQGNTYRFIKNSHTGTETLLLAAAMADGITVLENAAQEPEVLDLVAFLNTMGAKIELHGPRSFRITGVPELHGAIYKIMPDRNEVISYACAAIATKGDIVVENARPDHLAAFLQKLDDVGAGYQINDYGIRFYYKGPLTATDVTTKIHPGFMTDWQPLWATLVAHAQGVSTIHETVMQSRFQYVEPLQQMGAQIELFAPKVENPEEVYNFNLSDDKADALHALRITGPTQFKGGEFTIHDLRAGATLLLAALSGEGQTILHNLEQIDRGYEKLDSRLRQLGAKIERVE